MVSFVTLCDFVEQEIVLLKLLGDFAGKLDGQDHDTC